MKKFYLLLILSILININYIFTIDDFQSEIKNSLNFDNKNDKEKKEDEEKVKSEKEAKEKEELINFNYDNEDITNVINKLAAKKRINIIFPQPSGKIPAKITFTKYDMTLNEAWNLLITSLDLAGYTIIKKKKFYEIERNEDITKEPLEVYINSIDKLPNSDQRIRYVYFLENISINETSSPSYINLDQILKDMLGPETEGSTYILDPTTNSITIVGKSSTIKAAMKIIEELDAAGFPESIEVIPLIHTGADYISKIITQLIPGTQEPQFRYGPFPPKPSRTGGYYLSEQTKVLPIERTNSLAILGPPDSVQRIKDFIEKNLDLPIESEKSVVHVKPLQYLNADELAPVIQDLVKAKAAGAQAEATPGEKDTLANAIIVAEKQVQATAIQPTIPAQQQTAAPPPPATAPIIGGNRLIVAARGKDWQLISRLVDQLDQPQLQVAIEVLVVDLAITDNDLIGSQIRNSLNGTNPQFVNFQSSQLQTSGVPGNNSPPWLNFVPGVTPPQITAQGVASDLQRLTANPPYSDGTNPVNIASLAAVGSSILTFENGNGISYILQLLQNYNSATILSQPFVITKNNLQANFTFETIRYQDMGIDVQSTGGPIVRQRKPVNADLTVNILPRISKSSEINLEIVVHVNDFLAGTDNNVITTRQVRTNANLKNKEVLVLGGLARVDTIDQVTETPVLGKIPIIGFLFKNKSQNIIKRNLMIFISPSIIRPRLQGGIDTFTKNKIDFTKCEVTQSEIDLLGSNFDQLRDPITRLYFVPLGKQVNAAIDYYAEQKAYVAGTEEIEVAKEISLVGGSPENVGITNLNNERENAEKLKAMVRNEQNPLMEKIE